MWDVHVVCAIWESLLFEDGACIFVNLEHY